MTRHSSFFTKENIFYGLAEESLTLFPDVVRCPLFTAFSHAIVVALSGRVLDERKFVGRGQCRKRGTRRWGGDSRGDLRDTTLPLEDVSSCD